MKKNTVILVFIFIGISTFVKAQSFGFPLDTSGWYITQHFGVWNSSFRGYHLGEDYVANNNVELPVYAASNGIVKHVQSHTKYGYVTIIEHTLNDGSKVCSVYGHMRAANITTIGKSVIKGELIGYLSNDPNENGGYSFTHLHFGIRSGEYSTVLDSDGGWRYRGYGPSYIRDLWYDSGDFVGSHQNTIIPTLSTPNDNVEFTKGNVISFSWTSVTNAAYYEIWIDNSNVFGSPEIGFNNGISSNWINNGLVSSNNFKLTTTMQNQLPQNLYYWKVRALDNNMNPITDWSSSIRSFKLYDPLAPPTLSTPYENAEFTKGSDISFTWTNVTNAAYYEVWIDNNSGFGSPEIGFNNGVSSNWINNGIVSSNNFKLTTTWQNQLPQDQYYWKVRALDSSMNPVTDWSSDARSFKLYNLFSPPILLSPSDTAKITKGSNVSFSWTNVNNASFYEIWIDNNFGFGSPEVGFYNGASLNWVNDGIVNTNSFTFTTTLQDQLPQNVYYWKVRALDGNLNPITEWSNYIRNIELFENQGSKAINVSTAGTLFTSLTSSELNTVTNLTITGTIDARDFKTMRDNMPVLTVLDISSVTIADYTGTEGTYNTNSITYPQNCIPDDAFYNYPANLGKVSLTKIILPQTLTTIGNYGFEYCSNLTGITIPSTVNSIGKYAFNGCSKLSGVSIPNNVTNIGNCAFQACNALVGSLSIPSSVTSIGILAFCGTNYTSVSIPNSVTSIGSRAFIGCNMLSDITVDAGNLNYSSLNGSLFNKDQSTLIQYPAGKQGSYVIPSTVKSLGEYAIINCTKLTSVTLPSSLSTIATYALYGCSGLSTISIPSTVSLLDAYSLANCTNLTSLNLNNSNPPNVTSTTFDNINKTTCTLNVPIGSKSAYHAAAQWKDFVNIVETIVVPTNSPKEWNFSNSPFILASYKTQTTIDGLTIMADQTDSIVVNTTFQTNGSKSFTQRLVLTGSGRPVAGTYLPITRALVFNVSGSCQISVCCLSNSATENRKLMITNGTDSLGFFNAFTSTYSDALGNTVPLETFTYYGNAGKIYLYSKSSIINVYYIKVQNIDAIAPSIPNGLSSSTPSSNSFTLSWNASTDNIGVTGYDVYRDGVFYGSSLTTSLNITGLTAGTSYSMTVLAKDTVGNKSALSSPLVVKTALCTSPSPFNLGAPRNGTWIATTPWLEWETSIGASTFNLYIDGVLKKANLSTSHYQISQTEAISSGMHTWYVEASNGCITQSNETWSFQVDTTQPTAFGLVSPADNSWTANTQPTLTWNASTDINSGLVKYQLWIDGVLDKDNISNTTTSTKPSNILSNGSHTWEIRAVDNVGNVRNSTQIWTVKVDNMPPVSNNTNSYCLQFNGYSNYVIVPNSSSLNITNQKLTIEAWVKISAYKDWASVVTKGLDNPDYALRQHGGKINFSSQDYSGYDGNTVIPLNTWTHIAVTYDGTNIIFYLNGIYDGGAIVNNYIHNYFESLYIGVDFPTIDEYWNGNLDEIRIWNYTKTQADIINNKDISLSGFETNLAGYWRFNEGLGSVAFDMTSNHNNGTINGATFQISPLSSSSILCNLKTPTNNQFITSSAPSFSWGSTQDSGIGFQKFQLFIDGNMVKDNLSDSTCTVISPLLSGLHTWYVKGFDLLGNNQSSYSRTFYIDNVRPNIFNLTSPTNNQIVNLPTPNFTWQATTDSTGGSGMRKYQLLINGVVNQDSIPITQTTVAPKNALAQGAYTWSVKAYDNVGNVRQSTQTNTFYVDWGNPTAFTLVTPLDNSILTITKPEFKWHKSTDVGSGIGKYELNISGQTPISILPTDTTKLLTSNLPNGSYTWYVKAYDVAGGFTSSNTQTFTINANTSGVNQTEFNNSIKVYPNPVGNELIIELIDQNERRDFEIINSIGQVVYKGILLKKAVVQTSDFSSGIYIVKLENGKNYEFKKILKK